MMPSACRDSFTSSFSIWMPFISFYAQADFFRDYPGFSFRKEGENRWPLAIRNFISVLVPIIFLNYFLLFVP